MRFQLPKSRRDEPCDLCHGTQFQIVSERDRHGDRLVTVICTHCGLLCHEQVPSDDELEQYYARQYRAAYQGEYTPSAYRVLREWSRGRALVGLLRPYLQPRDDIVEIGCGIGCTVKNFECAGFYATGIEPGAGFRRFAVSQLHADVRPGMLKDVPVEPCVDMVLLVHVLEHLRQPTEALRHIHAMLTGGGRLYVEVPNAGAPHSAPGKMFHFAHIYNFTRDTLEAIAEKAGFSVLAWLGPAEDRNLRLLLERGDAVAWQAPRAGYRHALEALHRYSVLSYHLRWRYVRQRIETVARHTGNRVLARRRLRTLLAQCAKQAASGRAN